MDSYITGEWKTFMGTHEYEARVSDGQLLWIGILEHGAWTRYAPEQARHLIPAAVFSSIIDRCKEASK